MATGWTRQEWLAREGLGITKPTNTLENILAEFRQKEEQARLSNLQRYQQIQAIWDEIIRRYQPGGTFEKRALQQLAARKEREVGAGMQQLISAGLFGTQAAIGLPLQWEAAVGAPARLRLEDIMMQRLSQAQIGKAAAIERREDIYPNYALMAQLATQAAQQPRQRAVTTIIGSRSRIPSGRGVMRAPVIGEPQRPGPEYWERLERQRRAAAEVRASMAKQRPLPKTEPTGGKIPTIREWLIQHGLNPDATDSASIAKARRLQQSWAALYGKKRKPVYKKRRTYGPTGLKAFRGFTF